MQGTQRALAQREMMSRGKERLVFDGVQGKWPSIPSSGKENDSRASLLPDVRPLALAGAGRKPADSDGPNSLFSNLFQVFAPLLPQEDPEHVIRTGYESGTGSGLKTGGFRAWLSRSWVLAFSFT